MIVCVCKRVSDRDIARHAHAGLDFDDIREQTLAGAPGSGRRSGSSG